MAHLVAAAGTSHAFALRDPSAWDEGRLQNEKGYERKYGVAPDPRPQVDQETDEDLAYRYGLISRAHDVVRDRFAAANLDALIILGDDQNEDFTEATFLPQLAVYTGKEFKTRAGTTYRCAAELAYHLYHHTVDAGFEVALCGGLPDDVLKAHAFGPVLDRLTPKFDVPIIPVYVEAIHVPAPSPTRCFEFGRALAKAIEAWPGNERVGVVASGGISHYTMSYPYRHAPKAQYGTIDHEYDRHLFQLMADGRTAELASLSNQDLLDHGDPELHSWITLLGMIGDTKMEVLAYEPFYRAIMAMGVGYWQLEPALAR
jgi:hypothetical protein